MSEPERAAPGTHATAGVVLPSELKETIQEVAARPEMLIEPKQLERAVLAVITKSSISYSRRGPLPQPGELAEYERILPGSAARILASSERQMEHRLALEMQTVTAQITQSGRGQVFGFVIAIVGLLASFGAMFAGHEIGGTIIGSVDLVALVAVFVLGKQAQRTSLEKKAKAVPAPRMGE